MKKETTSPTGRILRHGKRADEVTAEAIELRARELALIDGRSAAQVTDGDRRRSRLELRGDHLPEGTLADAEGTGGISRDPAEPADNPGREVPSQDEPDEQATSERLAIEGVEEAQHDQMLAARRRDRRRSGPE
ncbi:hypothetical protein OPIT5_26820 [Opitutaceae bacterium TAV5]|nr:hypothetical protein OPIT5_26820 [Opitutaceae bacterium TAV5]